MSGLIQNRVRKDANHFGEQRQSKRDTQPSEVRERGDEAGVAQDGAARKGSFEEVMNILKGKEKLAQARRVLREGFMAKSSRA